MINGLNYDYLFTEILILWKQMHKKKEYYGITAYSSDDDVCGEGGKIGRKLHAICKVNK
jgi:hypothetical protein